MPVVADSSVLIGLVRIARLGLLRKLYRGVLIPQSVNDEVVVEGKRLHKAGVQEIETAIKAGWIKVVSLAEKQANVAVTYRARGGIGTGEAEAIALAKSRRLPVILDDRYARELANAVGLEFQGTGAVLLEAYLKRLLTKKEFMESLRDLGKVMWLSPDVVAELLRLAEEEDT